MDNFRKKCRIGPQGQKQCTRKCGGSSCSGKKWQPCIKKGSSRIYEEGGCLVKVCYLWQNGWYNTSW